MRIAPGLASSLSAAVFKRTTSLSWSVSPATLPRTKMGLERGGTTPPDRRAEERERDQVVGVGDDPNEPGEVIERKEVDHREVGRLRLGGDQPAEGTDAG